MKSFPAWRRLHVPAYLPVPPTSQAIAAWVAQNHLEILPTRTFQHYQQLLAAGQSVRKSHLGELAIQETMNALALDVQGSTGVFLFEDHKIARASFLLPDNCRKVSTRAFLIFLEQHGWIESAAEIERQAVLNGRAFSTLRFPP